MIYINENIKNIFILPFNIIFFILNKLYNDWKMLKIKYII